MTIGRRLAVNVPSSGTVTDALAQELEQQRLELVVGPVDLVDEEHGRSRAVVADAAQDRPLVQELLGEQVGLGQPVVAGLREADGEQLPLVVPLVQRLGRGEALVALEPDERRPERAGQRLRGRGLADPGLALEQQRTPSASGQVERGRRALVDQVADRVEALGELLGTRSSAEVHAVAGPTSAS